MCGILGSVRPGFTDSQACRALHALRHRGPDGHGLWRSPRGEAVLGHTRLSIIDLPGGRQPLVNETGDIATVVNGELYGYEPVMRELEAKGHRFSTECDSEIVLHLYEEHGLDLVRHLRGEFAFILWDDARGRLVAGRDRFGVKPLFYSRTAEGGVWIASEAKALFAAGLGAAWDEDAVYQHLFFMHEAGRSLFAGVEQLPPGHLLVLEEGRLRILRYWDLDYPVADDLGDSDQAEALEAFEAGLDDAVRVRLRADVPVGYFLSGGVDSSAVLAFASQHWTTPGRAFTVRFDQPEYDEGDLACRTASALGADFTPIALSHERLVHAYAEAIAHAETPGNLHAAARYLQCRAVSGAGYRVALTGDGADEILAGYVHYCSDVAGDAEAVPAALRSTHERLGHVPTWLRMLAIERSVVHLFLAPEYRDRMRERQPYLDGLEALDCAGQMRGRDPLFQSLYLWNKTMLPNYVLGAERLEMAHAVETRPPFLDHLLFDCVRRLSPASLVHGREGKRALRRIARRLVPEAAGHGKHPFAAPATLSVAGSSLHCLVGDTLHSGILKAVPFFDEAAVLEAWDLLPALPASRRFALEPVLLVVFGVCVLHERYVA